MFRTQEELLKSYPSLRRYIMSGFRYRPERDAPKFGMVCLESSNQRLFVEPETGLFRAGATVRH
jgi:hypothetical protein